ncbi:MAG: 2-dehydropantoate 2-reductase [Betaproteobacteria bacterium]
MKVCIVGAGAIGGFLGARLAAAGGSDVSALARGATLEALRTHGWRLQLGGALVQAPARASDKAADLGVQDLVVIAVKGPALTGVAKSIAPLIGSQTVVLPAMNGVPWWFFDGVTGPYAGVRLDSVDPGGVIGRAIPTASVIGCVVHVSAATSEPGVVAHGIGDRLIVGEIDGRDSTRLARLVELFSRAGITVKTSARIRTDIWYKLWGNLTMNPVTALTGATGDRVLDDPLVRGFCVAAMEEAATIGRKIGCDVGQTPEDRHVITRKLGAFRTSMLQDVEAGRPLEIDAIVGAVREIGLKVDVATPNIDVLLGLVRLFARVRGLYPLDGAAPSPSAQSA